MKDITKILFVEDILTDAELIWREIEKDDIIFEKKLVDNEQDFVFAISDFTPDLIISDYTLPQFDGLSALTIKNTLSPGIPFILVTGSVNEETAVKLMKAGADDYVIKENLSRLGEAIRSAILKKDSQRVKEKALNALRESEERFRLAVENSPVPVMIHDEEGKVLMLSKGWTSFSGYSLNDIPTVADWTRAAFNTHDCSEKAFYDQLININETKDIGEWALNTKNGDTRIWDFHVTPLGRVSEGKRVFQSLGTDVTESRKMQKKLIESEAYYRTLIDISPDGIITTDLKGKITYSSIKSWVIFDIPDGMSPNGTIITDWVMPEEKQKVRVRFAGLVSGTAVNETKEYYLKKFQGKPFWAELSSSPLSDRDGNMSGLLIVCRDISERKEFEKELIFERDRAEENDKLKTAFLHNISHEIRTPMNAIIGFSTLLAEPGQHDEQKDLYSEIIMNSCDQLVEVVSDIIEISNIEAGILKYKKGTFNINSQFASIYSQYLVKASGKEIVLNYSTMLSDDEAVIETDLSKLVTIMTNLLNNAFKFTHTGTIEFGCSKEGNLLRLYVSDTGIGIPEDKQSRIFERFYQVEHSVSRGYEGAGLGLSISKAFAEFLGGNISVRSKSGEGSLFVVTLPYTKADEKDLNAGIRLSRNKTSFSSTKTILVAEDDDNNYRLIERILSAPDWKVIRATNGREAVEMCYSSPAPDVILMDIKMPVMDGYSAAGEIKKLWPHIPVIAHTAYAYESDREKAMESGCDYYISKPIKKDELKSILEKSTNVHNHM